MNLRYTHTHTHAHTHTHTCTHTHTHTHTHTLFCSPTDLLSFLCKEALGLFPQPQFEGGVVQQLSKGLSPHHHCMLRALTIRVHLYTFLETRGINHHFRVIPWHTLFSPLLQALRPFPLKCRNFPETLLCVFQTDKTPIEITRRASAQMPCIPNEKQNKKKPFSLSFRLSQGMTLKAGRDHRNWNKCAELQRRGYDHVELQDLAWTVPDKVLM